MRIAIDAVTPGASLEPTVAGMRHYVVALVSAMSALDTSNEFLVFEGARAPLKELDELPNVRRITCRGILRNRAARVLYQNIALPMMLRRHHVDVTLGTCNVIPIGSPRPCVVVLQSLQYFVHRSTFGRLRGTYLRASVRSSVHRADAVIALSHASKDEAVGFTAVNPGKVAVVYHGVPYAVRAYATQSHAVRPTESQYILAVSSLHRYKNVDRVVRAFAELRRTYDVDYRLRVVGQSAELTISELKALADELQVGEWVDFLGGVSHLSLPEHYAGAELLVYASLHETFGLPPLEAMALGCPVVVARASSLPEVVGDAAELVDPLEVSDIARGMARVLRNPVRRAELVRLGLQRAAEFTWERAATGTLNVLRSVA